MQFMLIGHRWWEWVLVALVVAIGWSTGNWLFMLTMNAITGA